MCQFKVVRILKKAQRGEKMHVGIASKSAEKYVMLCFYLLICHAAILPELRSSCEMALCFAVFCYEHTAKSQTAEWLCFTANLH